MLVFDGLDFQTRIVKLRPRQTQSCLMCSRKQTSLNEHDIRGALDLFDYSLFCGGINDYNDKGVQIKLLDDLTERVSCNVYKEIIERQDQLNDFKTHLLIDVRPECQFKICSLPNSISKTQKLSTFGIMIFYFYSNLYAY
jgi:hypothetical protein